MRQESDPVSGNGRPGLPSGAWGSIAVQHVGPSRYKARARFADMDGVTRTVARFAQTETKAKRRLQEALAERAKHGRIDRETTVRDLARFWLDALERRDLAPRTVELYRYMVERRIIGAPLGKLRVADATTGACDLALQALESRSEAKTLRTILNGMFRLAVAHGAAEINPIREVASISTRKGKKPPRALTVTETEDLTDRLRSDARAVLLDMPDLVEWMLGTGCRIGEALAVRDESLDLDVGTVAINATVVRLKGRGLVLERPKTPMSNRVLVLPSSLVGMVIRRRNELRFHSPEHALFPSPFAPTLRDPGNLAGDMRAVLDRLGYGWVTSHTFRKTVATRLDEAGQSERQVADQLGHAQPSMTQNVYFGRAIANPDAARILDR